MRDPEARLPLTAVVFEILVSLARDDRHGYAILTDVRERTGATLRPGSLYRALGHLLADGLIEERDEPAGRAGADERRRHYRLTPLGRRVAAAEAARLEAQVRSARSARLLPRRRT
jgi:DNA-binding PadR family transcriptional regulator